VVGPIPLLLAKYCPSLWMGFPCVDFLIGFV